MIAPLSVVVEGITDEVVVIRILEECGLKMGVVRGLKGRSSIEKGITGYNNAVKRSPWFVLVDLDQDSCAGELCQSWLPNPSPLMCLRVVIREVESWLLADAVRLAGFLKVSPTLLPDSPESLADPKRTLVNLARRSRSVKIRDGLVPRIASGRVVGELYTSLVTEFVMDREKGWRPAHAAQSAPSLDRCIKAIRKRFQV